MKKMITTLAAIASTAVFAIAPADFFAAYDKAKTSDEKTQLVQSLSKADALSIIDYSIANTNALRAYRMFAYTKNADQAKAALYEKDGSLAAAGVKANFWLAAEMPQCYAAWKAENASRYPKTVAYVQAGNDIKSMYKEDPALVLNIAAEWAAANNVSNRYNSVGWLYQAASKRCTKDIKKALRRQHKSFITKDGKNPIQDEIDKLSAAFNAPKMAGLEAWVKSIWPDYDWVEPTWPSAADVAAEKQKVLDSELEFNKFTKEYLLYNLGVAEYNKFVEEYNGAE